MWFFWLHPLRGFAALGVVLLHSYWTWSGYDFYLIRKLYLFVDLFFILSGFVMPAGYHYFLKDFKSILSFIGKRLNRLFFHYYASGFVWLVALLLTMGFNDDLLYSSVRYFAFLDIYFESNYKINPVAWSVMAEFAVYVIFAFLVVYLKNASFLIFISFLISILGFGSLVLGWMDLNIISGLGGLLRAISGFFIGFTCWQLIYTIKNKTYMWVYVLMLLGVATVGVYKAMNYDGLFIMFACVLVVFIHDLKKPRSIVFQKYLKFIGDISYPLYMWHFIVSVVISKYINKFYSIGDKIVFNSEPFVAVSYFCGNSAILILFAISLTVSVFFMKINAFLGFK